MIALALIHIIGAIFSIIFCIKTGILKDAKEHGDGIRFALPSDVIFQCILLWEVLLLVHCLLFIDKSINSIDW